MTNQVRIGWRRNTPQSINYLISSLTAMSTPILNTYTGAGAAYSLRKLSTSYAGSSIRVRRSNDNAEQNIGFDGSGNLDTTALLTFVGSASGFVTTWYDQSGNSKNAIQTTATSQPNIVINGTLRTQGTRPSFYFDGVDDYFDCGYVNGGIKPGTFSTWISANITDASQTRNIFSSGDSGGHGITGYNQFGIHSSIGYKMFGAVGDGNWVNNTESGFYRYYSTATAPATNQRYLFEQHYLSNSTSTSYVGQFWWNDTQQSVSSWLSTGAVKSSGPEYKTSIGRSGEYSGGGYFQGMMQEIITYFNDKTSVRKEIVANINSYYSIYNQDTNPLTAAAYSLRKLRDDYTGSAIRVRRSADNAETNIGFVNGNLDETSLISFAGSNNSFLYTEEFDNAYWTKTAVTITANSGVAPDGTQTADLFQENGGSGYHYVSRQNTSLFSVNSSWNMSFYVKKSPDNTLSSNRIMLRQFKNDYYTDGGTTTVFNLESGSVDYYHEGTAMGGTLGILGATMSNQGNGWWRCSMWGTRPASVWGGQSTDVAIAIGRATTTTGLAPVTGAWSGDVNAKYFIWGVQLTFKNADTSYLNIKPYTKATNLYPGGAYVTTWFDQSGNGRNLTQATAANQPPVMEDGTVLKLNGKPTLSFYFAGVTRRWIGMAANSTTINPPFSMFLNIKLASAVDFKIVSGLETNKNFGISSWTGNWVPTYTFYGSDNNWIAGDLANTNNSIHFVYTSNMVSSKIGRNGTTYTKGISPGAWKAIQIGMSDSNQFYASELIFFYGDKSTNRTTIESDINTYYSVY